jgi:hypothetical protein
MGMIVLSHGNKCDIGNVAGFIAVTDDVIQCSIYPIITRIIYLAVTVSWTESDPSLNQASSRWRLSYYVGRSRPSQAPRERSFARKQDYYCNCCGYDRHSDKIEDCPAIAEVFKNLWKRQKDKVVSA